MADVTLSYKGDDILELSDSGSATLKTGGYYCDADIEVEYAKPVEETVRSKWFRPPDMPDYDSLTDKTIFNRDENGSSYQINAFMTVATNIPGADTFCIRGSQSFNLSIGTIENGAFSSIGNLSLVSNYFTVDLTQYQNIYKYLVVHIVRNSPVISPTQDTIAWSVAHPRTGASPVVEVYGLWDDFSLVEINYSPSNFYTFRYATLWGRITTNAMAGYMNVPRWMEYLDLTNATMFLLRRPLTSALSLKQLLLPSGKVNFESGATTAFSSCISLVSLDLSNADWSVFTTLESWFSSCLSLQDLDLTNADWSAITTTTNIFNKCYSLQNIVLDGATLPSVSFSLADSSELTSASLVGIANALPTASATLTLHATPKANLSTIMGTVADGTFTADENGTATLMDFITNTKGWTVA